MRMRHITQISRLLLAAATNFVAMAAIPVGSPPPTTTFILNGIGSGANLAGVYTSPYTGQVDGLTSPTISVICDDFGDDTYVPEEWTAYVTPLSSLTPGTTDTYLKWVNSPGGTITVNGEALNQSQAYTVAAVLATNIMQSTGLAQQVYSFALWGLFDTDAFTQLAAYYGAGNTYETTAQTFLNNAVSTVLNNNLKPTDYSNVTIYSYDSPLAGGTVPTCGANLNSPCATIPPQEFIAVKMAEPPSPALLALDLLAVAGLMAVARRAKRKTVSLNR